MPQYKEPKVVAEIGCNHKGDLGIAKEMIKIAAVFCQVDYVKFQKRNPKELLSEKQYNSIHPNPFHSYGRTYGEHREYLEFSLDQHKELKDYCENFNIGYSSSVWDLTSAKEIISLSPDYIKVPSASNTHEVMLSYLCDHYEGDIHLSLGMTLNSEKDKIISLFEKKNRLQSLVLYHTTSAYPVEFESLCLMEIKKLRKTYGNMVKAIGFSGHHLGIFADVIAYSLGATWVERHFTLDRTWKGTDHAASLEPDGLRRVKRDLTNCKKALTFKTDELLPVEVPGREKLKWKNNKAE
jgi:sialic acid synthase